MLSSTKLPSFFKPILWSYDFNKIDPRKTSRSVIINAINYGDLKHWRWIIDFYGKSKIKNVIAKAKAAEIRDSAKKLTSLLIQ